MEKVYLSDLIDTKSIEQVILTPEERRAFLKDVEREMMRLGFDRANELTEKSTILTGKDYKTYINY